MLLSRVNRSIHDDWTMVIAMRATRTADPYRDIDVIDKRAPRFNQATVAIVCAAAIVTGWWPLVGLLALQLIVGLRFGRQFCLACVFYFEVIQPRMGEGPIEDARPPRFANQVGAVFLGASTAAHAFNFHTTGRIVAGIVACLAALAATTGFCVGCEIYRLVARLRGVRAKSFDRVDLLEIGAAPAPETLIQFTHPLCSGCKEVTDKLSEDGRPLVLVDVSQRPDLARKYGVLVVPLAVAVGSDGVVTEHVA